MSLRAVVFDYGMVLTGPQDPEAYAALLQITGLTKERFDSLYWNDRHAYDEGKLSGIAFWRKFTRDAGMELAPSAIEELNHWDALMWTTLNTSMLAWQEQLKKQGLLTAILSNMGDNVHNYMQRKFDWLARFDVLVWSYQLGIAKPDPAIYHYVLNELGLPPEETLFIDDKPINIEAAGKLGMKGVVFTNVEQLRRDLIAAGFDKVLPLPA